MRYFLLLFVTLIFGTTHALAQEGPFGVSMGQDPASIATCKVDSTNPGFCKCDRLPKHLDMMWRYLLKSHPSTGVCLIRGMTDVIDTNRHGTQIISKINEIADVIETAYGKSESIDILPKGSLWDEPQYWTMSILKEERFYGKKWTKTPVADIADVYVVPRMVQPTIGAVMIEVRFKNSEDCNAAIKADRSKAF